MGCPHKFQRMFRMPPVPANPNGYDPFIPEPCWVCIYCGQHSDRLRGIMKYCIFCLKPISKKKQENGARFCDVGCQRAYSIKKATLTNKGVLPKNYRTADQEEADAEFAEEE